MPKLLLVSPRSEDGSAVPRHCVLLLILTMTSSLGMVASTIYVPSIPAIAAALDTSIAKVQLTFVGYLLAFAASMLVLGPLSDRYGRRRTIFCGLALSTIGSVACAVSPTIDFLIAARVIQGIGACAGLDTAPATEPPRTNSEPHHLWGGPISTHGRVRACPLAIADSPF